MALPSTPLQSFDSLYTVLAEISEDLTQHFPEYVKQANIQDFLTPKTGVSAQFYPQYPWHNKQSAFLSCVRYELNKKKLPESAEPYFQKIAQFWKIEDDLKKVFQAMQQKQADAEQQYGICVRQGDQVEVAIPLRSSEEVARGLKLFVKHAYEFPFQIRRSFADKLLQKIQEFSVAVPPEQKAWLEKTAGQAVPAVPEKISQALVSRKIQSLPGHPQVADLYDQAILALQATPWLERQHAVKIAELMDSLDRVTGLVSQYSSLLPDPVVVVFEQSFGEKEASTCHRVGGVHVLADIFGENFANTVRDGMMIDEEKFFTEARKLPAAEQKTASMVWQMLSQSS